MLHVSQGGASASLQVKRVNGSIPGSARPLTEVHSGKIPMGKLPPSVRECVCDRHKSFKDAK